MKQQNNAIVCLTRGYAYLRGYDVLIKRNQSIYEHINKDLKYPLIIFHEGNIPIHHQDHIISLGFGQDIRFVDVSKDFSGGYEGMCQFQTYHIWNYCKQYDYILRVDEDCWITGVAENPFDQIGNYLYLKSVYSAEPHSETNATLPDKILSLLPDEKKEDFYNDKYPYTNVGLAKVSFFTDSKINDLLYMIAMCPDQRTYRWGDLPIIGSILNIFAKGEVGTLTGLSYFHQSHGNTVVC